MPQLVTYLDKFRLQTIVSLRDLVLPVHAKSATVFSTNRGFLRRARGFTLLELVVVICLVAILFTVAANRLWGLQALAEQTAMETVLGNLRSALGMKVAELFTKGDMTGLRALDGSNPMALLAQMPENYLGEQADQATQRGSWIYRPGDRTLVYRVKNEASFKGYGGRPEARFRVRLVFDDRNRNGRFDPGRDAVNGVRLVAVEPYAWSE